MLAVSLQILQGFNLEALAHHSLRLHKEEQERKRAAEQKLTLPYVLSDAGFPLLELFGYHFANRISEPLAALGLTQGLIRVNIADFLSLISQQWLNMGEYSALLPVLFQLFKGSDGTVSLRKFDRYLDVPLPSLRSAGNPSTPSWLDSSSYSPQLPSVHWPRPSAPHASVRTCGTVGWWKRQ